MNRRNLFKAIAGAVAGLCGLKSIPQKKIVAAEPLFPDSYCWGHAIYDPSGNEIIGGQHARMVVINDARIELVDSWGKDWRGVSQDIATEQRLAGKTRTQRQVRS